MSAKTAAPEIKTGFNYLVCLDVIVLACILVVAGRPDGLAITLSAIIVATGAVLYRCSVALKSSVSGKPSRAQAASSKLDRSFGAPMPSAPVESAAEALDKSKSWLRDFD